MRTAGKRIASFGIVMLLTLTYAWQVSLAEWNEAVSMAAGYSGELSLGSSTDYDNRPEASSDEAFYESSPDIFEGTLGVSLGSSGQISLGSSSDNAEDSSSNISLGQSAPSLMPAAAPAGGMLRAGSVNVMKDFSLHSIEESGRTDWFYSNETISVRIDFEYNGAIPAGSMTVITLPDKLAVVKTSDTIAIPNENDGNRIIGTATIDTASNSLVIIANNGAEKANKVTGYVIISADVNRAELSNPNFAGTLSSEDFEIVENNSNSIIKTKDIKNRQVTGSYHLFYKSGSHTENGIIQWATNVNYYGSPETRRNLTNIEVVDRIGEDHELVSGSIKVTAYTWIYQGPDQLLYSGSPYDITLQCTRTPHPDGQGFTVTIPDTLSMPSDFDNRAPYPYRISYQTAVTDNFARTKYENTATLAAYEDGVPVGRTSNNLVVVEAGSGGMATTAELTVEKVDEDSGEALAGAVFELRNDKEVTVATLTTDSNGIATYEGPLVIDRIYKLYEVQTPSSKYELAAPVEVVVTSSSNKVTKTIKNKKAAQLGILEIRKLDKDGYRLSDATFILFKDAGMTLPAEDQYGNTSWTTGSGGQPGVVRIEGLPVGTYYLLETEAPQGYLRDDTLHEVEVLNNPSGVTTIPLYNDRDELDLVVLKEDAKDGTRLAGGEFTAYRKAPSGNWTEVDTFTIPDKDTGYSRRVIVGEYRIWENAAPEGYQLPNEYIEFTITESDKQQNSPYTIIISNDPLVTDAGPASARAFTHELNEYYAIGGAGLALYKQNGSDWDVVVNEVTTGSAGLSGVIGGLHYGTYKFAPQNDPEGYIHAIDEQPFELNMQTASRGTVVVPVPYVPQLATLEIVKYDMDTDTLLSGATFSLQSSSRSGFSLTETTGSDGKIVFYDVPYGTYLLWETNAPQGYFTSGYATEVIIDEKNETIRVPNKLADANTSSDATLVKLAAGNTNTRLAGAKFDLELLQGNTPVLYLHDLQTDRNGEIYIHSLPDGIYRFVETAAPSGYEITDDTLITAFTVNGATDDFITVTVHNSRKAHTSSTGDGGKGSNTRDVYRMSSTATDPTPAPSTPSGTTEDGVVSVGQKGEPNPWTGMRAPHIPPRPLALSIFCILLGCVLMFGYRKDA